MVGEYQCPSDGLDGGATASTTDIAVPWHTGFEDGACDYYQVAGSCYRWPPIDFRRVDWPVHSGQYAAEISVVTGTDGGSQPQGRCFRQGIMPVEAYYGAWYFIPNTTPLPKPIEPATWNLFFIQGNQGNPDTFHELWDVHLTTRPAGLSLELFSKPFLPIESARFSPPVPIGRWFHVVLYLKRAKDKTGAVALYLGDDESGDVKAVEFTNLATDDDTTAWAQWYVGNLASAMDPPESTVYLDDVTIRSTL